MQITGSNLREIFLSGAPLMDMRAPIEFARGSFPGAVNLPLMSDAERAAVGTCYKNEGQQAAIELGHRMVSGDIKAQRVGAWANFARQHPDGYLFCFRGGLRSQIAQRWLAEEAGVVYPRINGGYKAMRHFLMETTARVSATSRLMVVGGMTGTGKTEFLQMVRFAVDLEGAANHRGSGFGRRVSGQPAQIDFEHRVAIRLLALEQEGADSLLVEDEGVFIGCCSIPETLYNRMQDAPILWLEDRFENRVNRILKDYVLLQHDEHLSAFGEQGIVRFESHLLDSLFRIRKRLGGERHERARKLMIEALKAQNPGDAEEMHRDWIRLLLREYYDPMYVHQQSLKESRIIATGDSSALLPHVTDS